MALLSASRFAKNPRISFSRTIFMSQKDDGPSLIPEKPYWDGPEKKPVKGFDKIPGPKPIFYFGNSWRYNRIIGEYSHDRLHETYAKMFKQYGYIVKEKLHPVRTFVHLFHPEDIMQVFKKPGPYPLRQSHSAIERYRRERPHIYNSTGLGPSNGEDWKTFRALFTKVGGQALLITHKDDIDIITNDLVDKISRGLDENNEIDIRIPLFRWALEIVGIVTLNQRLGCLEPEKNAEADRLIKAAHTTHEVIYKFETRMNRLLKWREYKRLVEAQEYFEKIIRKRLLKSISDSHGKRTNLLNLVLINNPGSTTQDVCTLILDLFQGGIHTVSYTLCFAMLHLAKNKALQDRIRKLMIETMPTKTSKIADGEPSTLLNNTMSETLRMNPPTIGTGRILGRDLVLGGYEVPAGTMAILHGQVASMQEEFFRNPTVFDPDRWNRRDDPGVVDGVGKFAYIPFGFGVRGCIASGLARLEMKIALGKILRNFEITYHHEPVNTVNKLHNEPDKPVRLRLKKLDN